MSKKLVIIGASGHGKVIADIAKKNGYTTIVFLDDDSSKEECAGYKVVGTTKDLLLYKYYDFIVGIGNAIIRKRIQTELTANDFHVITLIHPNAVVADDVRIGEGTVIAAGAVINPCVTIGNGCIINTGASVDHDNVIEDFAHISVGSHLAGTVAVGEGTMIGAGAVVINNVSICAGCMVGAGAVVVKNIENGGTYAGVPARWIK